MTYYIYFTKATCIFVTSKSVKV